MVDSFRSRFQLKQRYPKKVSEEVSTKKLVSETDWGAGCTSGGYTFGYSPASARRQGHRLTTDVNISALLDKREGKQKHSKR